MTYRTILVDDEPLALDRMKRLLKPHRDTIEIIYSAQNGLEAVETINRLNPDLIFLDIQMPELSGFEVLDRVNHLPLIIFCTAYDEYALKAFETNSIDYLLKPVEPERLNTAIEKLWRLTSDDKESFHEQLQKLLSGMKKPAVKRIRVSSGDTIHLVPVDEIFFFRAEEKYVIASTYDKSYVLNQTLNQLEAELSTDDFVRIHRSAIINLNHLEKIIRWFGGNYRVRMRDKEKTELDISRGSKHKLGL